MHYKISELTELDSTVKTIVQRRIREFSKLKTGNSTTFNLRPYLDRDLKSDHYCELFFCILAANYSAKRACLIQSEIKRNEWFTLTRNQLLHRLLDLGYRFPAVRSAFIVKNRANHNKLMNILRSDSATQNKRQDLINTFYGLGMKTASQLLRNTGHFELPIIDRQIYKFLVQKFKVQRYKTLTENRYKELEEILMKIADANGMTPGELDLYIFYLQTGVILK
ncbi:MAG: N-glycosylase [Planctomycetes bacterium]|nr:N-glycosylase [Planctomycetota bacterium]